LIFCFTGAMANQKQKRCLLKLSKHLFLCFIEPVRKIYGAG
jgi:hypothetical protein